MENELEKVKDLLERCYDFLEDLPCYNENLKNDLDNYFWRESEEKE